MASIVARLEGSHHLKKLFILSTRGRRYVMKGPKIMLAQGPLKAQIRHCIHTYIHIYIHTFYACERERNVLFNDALNTFYLRLYCVRHMVKDHSDSEKGNPLPPHRLLLSSNSNGCFICTMPQTG